MSEITMRQALHRCVDTAINSDDCKSRILGKEHSNTNRFVSSLSLFVYMCVCICVCVCVFVGFFPKAATG